MNKNIELKIMLYFRRYIEIILLLLLIALVASSIIMVYAYRQREYIENKYTITYASLKATVKSAVKVKPALIYDYRTVINTNQVYYNLVKEIVVNISVKTVLNSKTSLGKIVSANTSVSMGSVIKSGSWAKSYDVTYVKVKDNPLTYTISIDVNKISKVVNVIDSEINQRTREFEYEIPINIVVRVKYSNGALKTYNLNPKIIISFNKDANRISISSKDLSREYSSYSRNVKPNIFNPIGMTIVDARKTSLYMVLAFTALFLVTLVTYVRKVKLTSKPPSYLSKHSSQIIYGELVDKGSKPIVSLQNIESLFKLAKHYKKPILYSRKDNSFYLILSDTIYMYNLPENKES
ncbi:hypothetical protein J4526_06780 [Desulfurococcaceae archaeon MEX13E-LK6-19]|nr:hypothetical protein J4526_06780 [Desulfurococcaceae archaeon MEX13E-LK6-19]